MKPRHKLIRPRFRPETRFKLVPTVNVGAQTDVEAGLEQLKRKLVRRLIAETTRPGTRVRIRQAVNEAAALAWSAGNPLLLLPVLADEMAVTARMQAEKQERVLEQSKSLLPELAELRDKTTGRGGQGFV